VSGGLARPAVDKTDDRHRWLLRSPGERPRNRQRHTAWTEIFAVECELPSGPPVGGHADAIEETISCFKSRGLR
jgi:hypothetical protein